jgi:hypothetical protein
MALLNRLERLFGRIAIPNISLYLVLGQVVFWSVAFLGFFDLERIALLPLAVRHGEAWRLFTFLLMPPISSPVFIAFSWYLFWMYGTALEHHWGVFRYNLFIFVGWALTVGVVFLFHASFGINVFLLGSIFLAFAFLNPDFEIRVLFILPVKIKWLALIEWLWYGYVFLVSSWSVRLGVLASVGNFLLFFSSEIVQRMKTGRRQVEYRSRQSSAREEVHKARHKCFVCGKTDLSDPQMDFRYCSKCAGEECYCMEHIANHPHTVAANPKP